MLKRISADVAIKLYWIIKKPWLTQQEVVHLYWKPITWNCINKFFNGIGDQTPFTDYFEIVIIDPSYFSRTWMSLSLT